MPLKHKSKMNSGKSEAEKPNASQLQQEIEQLAYRFYCECGYKHGYDLDHWLEAERRVFGHHQRDSGGIS